MTKKPNQDLADKALAEEFGSYIKLVAGEIVTPISESVLKAQSSINKSLKESKDSSISLICTMGEIGAELKTTVASVYSKNEATRQELIKLLETHKNLATAEAATQIQMWGKALQAELETTMEDSIRNGLIKPLTEVVSKTGLEYSEITKQIAQKVAGYFRDLSGELASGIEKRQDEIADRLACVLTVEHAKNEQRHRRMMLGLAISIGFQAALIVLFVMGVGR
jgi:phage-related tail protein